VTLRAIARAVGIAAPSIYAHFPDREAVLDELMADAFVRLTTTLDAAIMAASDPVERLLAGCRAYMEFAAEEPHRYRLLFQRPGDALLRRRPESPSLVQGRLALETLVQGIRDCVNAGRSASDDPFADALAVWVSLHGLATLEADNQAFPWPEQQQLVTSMVSRLARLAMA
jgi:AcrR family transcriptional regulator